MVRLRVVLLLISTVFLVVGCGSSTTASEVVEVVEDPSTPITASEVVVGLSTPSSVKVL